MAYIFGDGFDCYATVNDAGAGYWDSLVVGPSTLQAGRFAGGQCWQWVNTGAAGSLTKSSGVNDPVHHIVCAFRQTAALSGTTLGAYFQLIDNVTNQVCIVFRSDGAILLTSATPAGTVLATYSGAVTAANTWIAFEFEVVINNTTGSFKARKNGNTVDDFSAGSLNTRPGANAYANKLLVGVGTTTVNAHQVDDLLWRSDAASVPFVGDIRCYTRMPASDASTQFARAPTTLSVNTGNSGSTAITAGSARYHPQQAAPCDGTITSVTLNLVAGFTGNMKCAVFAAVSLNQPGVVLATATPIANPVTGNNTFTFPTPASLTKGTNFIVGYDSDTASGTWNAGSSLGSTSVTAYAAFPASTPTVTTNQQAPVTTISFTPAGNCTWVNEAQQDGTTSYVYDSTAGHADFYNVAAPTSTPTSVVAVTTRGFMQKSDTGTRTGAMQLKSGATTVATPTVSLNTTFGWAWRTDLVDPDTSAAWTVANANAVQCGPVVIS